MSNWTVFCRWFYTQALRLYPREFRADFGNEMRTVFMQAIEAQAGISGTWVSLIVIGRIIKSLNLEESWCYTNALSLGWVLLCIVGYFLIVFKSKLHGLLSVAFFFPMLSVTMLASATCFSLLAQRRSLLAQMIDDGIETQNVVGSLIVR